MGNSSDIHAGVDHPASRNGVNDPVGGLDVRRTFNDDQTPHERAQWAADVRAWASPKRGEDFLPEGLRRPPTAPLNPRTGRRATD